MNNSSTVFDSLVNISDIFTVRLLLDDYKIVSGKPMTVLKQISLQEASKEVEDTRVNFRDKIVVFSCLKM